MTDESLSPSVSPTRQAQRVRLAVASAVFAVWVVCLGVMAVTSGRRPQNTAPAAVANP